MQLSWVLVLPALALAAICPLEEHQICNLDNAEHACACGVTPADEKSVPYQSCNNLIDRGDDDDDDDDDKSDEEDEGEFEAVSVTFKLDEQDGHDKFPEDQFKETISTSLRVDEEDILILRANCVEEDDDDDSKFVVQFAILKKNNNETEMPYELNDFIDAESIVTRMKAMGHLDKIADLDVDDIEFVKELIDIEQNPDNTELIIQAIFVGAGFFLMFMLGIFMCVRNQGYSDELQKA